MCPQRQVSYLCGSLGARESARARARARERERGEREEREREIIREREREREREKKDYQETMSTFLQSVGAYTTLAGIMFSDHANCLSAGRVTGPHR